MTTSAHTPLLSLGKAYGARWSSAFGHRDLRYNGRLWKPLPDHHSPEDVFFGLLDPSDGSSFLIRIETVEDLDDLEDADIKDSMSESIADERFNTRHLADGSRDISGVRFNFVEYAITNAKFGEQVICQAYARGDGQVTLLSLTWPRYLPRGGDGLPVKFAVLLDGLSL